MVTVFHHSNWKAANALPGHNGDIKDKRYLTSPAAKESIPECVIYGSSEINPIPRWEETFTSSAGKTHAYRLITQGLNIYHPHIPVSAQDKPEIQQV